MLLDIAWLLPAVSAYPLLLPSRRIRGRFVSQANLAHAFNHRRSRCVTLGRRIKQGVADPQSDHVTEYCSMAVRCGRLAFTLRIWAPVIS